MNGMETKLFYGLALASVLLAMATVLTRQILRSAVYLMGVLCMSAGLYLVLGAEFLAGVQVLVYVGGIVVLLVFAVMLTRSEELAEDRPSLGRRLMGAAVAIAFFAVSAKALSLSPLNSEPVLQPHAGDIAAIGRGFLDAGSGGYLLPFEVISLLLLGVLIAGIVLARREGE